MKLFKLTIGICCLTCLTATARGQSIPEHQKRSILRLVTPDKRLGTGFILSDSLKRFFLITNKHVLQDCSTGGYFDSVAIRLNKLTEQDDAVVSDEKTTLYLRLGEKSFYYAHPTQGVDLVAVAVGNLRINDSIQDNPRDFEKLISTKKSKLVPLKDFGDLGIGSGTKIQVVGFSFQGIQKPQFHISRFGHLSIIPPEPITLRIASDCDTLVHSQKWIILDISSRGGDSGAPVYAFHPSHSGYTIVGVVQAGNSESAWCAAIPVDYVLEVLDSLASRPLWRHIPVDSD
jgi:hypothetical protein